MSLAVKDQPNSTRGNHDEITQMGRYGNQRPFPRFAIVFSPASQRRAPALYAVN